LFIELYLDEDVDVLVADLIRARGFTASTARDVGNLHEDDDEQLAHAADNQLAFVTHNRADIVRRLLVILNNVTADEMVNQIRYI
jgi:predicted nuclease of predicted toxin-antitoxin system